MSLAMEETTFHVGKPFPSAQARPGEKGCVNAFGAPTPAGRGHVPRPGGLTSVPQECVLSHFVSLFKGALWK